MSEKLFLYSKLKKDKVNKYTKKKGDLTYLSWTIAWDRFMNNLEKLGISEDEVEADVITFKDKDGSDKPYVYDENTGYMVFTYVKVLSSIKKMWLPVMDSNNKAMKNKPYTFKVKEYKFSKWTGNYVERTVEPATMTDINKAIMRCLVKNIALFGLGIDIYNGEDLPEDTYDERPEKISNEMEQGLRELIRTKNIPDQKVIEVLKENGFKKLGDVTADKVVNIRNELARY